jgi:hypothetical protein
VAEVCWFEGNLNILDNYSYEAAMLSDVSKMRQLDTSSHHLLCFVCSQVNVSVLRAQTLVAHAQAANQSAKFSFEPTTAEHG